MIQSLADKYKKHIAYPLLLVLYLQLIIAPLQAAVYTNYNIYTTYDFNNRPAKIKSGKSDLEGGNHLNFFYDKEIPKKTTPKYFEKRFTNFTLPFIIKK